VTHRCHNREFLLKFALDRDGYRAKLREHLAEFDVALLDYCITANHVHLLLDAEERMQISGLMRRVAGEFARVYNRRKERMNAFWEIISMRPWGKKRRIYSGAYATSS